MSDFNIIKEYINRKFDNLRNKPTFEGDVFVNGILHGTGLSLPKESVTQLTSININVTINSAEGTIITQPGSAIAGATHAFAVNNTFVESTSNVYCNIINYTGTGIPYLTINKSVGSFTIIIRNIHTTDAFNSNFTISFLVTNS